MLLNRRLRPWSGDVFRHLPLPSPELSADRAALGNRLLDFSHAGQSPDNRWNAPGQPTLYAAGDQAVAAAEWARHLRDNRTQIIAERMRARMVYRLSIEVERVLDARDSRLWEAISLQGAPMCFGTISLARATAEYLRATTDAQGLLVPSMAFLDDPDRWCMVLFLDKLSTNTPGHFVRSWQDEGPLRFGK